MGSDAYRVEVTESFRDDLEAAVAYYREASGPRSAARFLTSYESFVDLVEQIPGHGTPIEDTPLRWRKVGVFIAVYLASEDPGTVMLLRLFYMSSNWRSHARRIVPG